MNRLLSCLLPLATVTVLSACATLQGPAEVSGQVKLQPGALVTAARIYEVDGATVHKDVASVESGRRTIRIQALPQTGFRGGEVKPITVDIKPCVRTLLGVKRESTRSLDWEPVVAGEEPITGCTPRG